MLGEAFEAAGGLDRFLQHTTVIVTSDHGHCEVLEATRRRSSGSTTARRLPPGGARTAVAQARRPVMICPNMRAAQIYVQHPTPRASSSRSSTAIARDPEGGPGDLAKPADRGGTSGYTVAHVPAAALRVRARPGVGQRPRSTLSADTGRGTGEAGGARTSTRTAARCASGDYPNAFERIAGVLDLDKSGEIWVTAKPGCEFEVPGGKAHVGGASHGALHALDSLSPVIIAGGARAAPAPAQHALGRHRAAVHADPRDPDAIPGRGSERNSPMSERRSDHRVSQRGGAGRGAPGRHRARDAGDG